MADFERASRNSAENIFSDSDCNIIGCFAHYARAIFKNVQVIGLSILFNSNIRFKKWVKKIIACPLAPSTEIHALYNELLQEEFPEFSGHELALLGRFKRYVRRQWIHNIDPETLSVHGQDSATNNGAESFHRYLKSEIKVHHPNIWTFMVHINEILLFRAQEFRRLQRFSPEEIIRNRRPRYIKNQEIRRQAEAKLERGEINLMEFLSTVSHTTDRQIERLQNAFRQNNNVYEGDPDIIDDIEEVVVPVNVPDENENTPPPDQGVCRWCRNIVQNEQKCVFSCSHGLGCLPCSENFYQQGLLTNEGPKCPECSVRITMVVPINMQLG